MNKLPENEHEYAYKRLLKLATLLIILGMCCVEFFNCVRIWNNPENKWEFPDGYVSRGLCSFGAYIRLPDTFNVDIAPILKAAVRMLKRNPDQYGDFQIAGSNNFYPPSAALLFAPFGLIVNFHSGDLSVATQIIDVLWRMCALVTLIVAVWQMREIASSWKQAVAAFLILACFYPLRLMLLCVQAQSLVTLLLVFAIVAFARSHSLVAGILIGVAGCIKPQFGLIAFFAVFRREWLFLSGMIISSACLLLGTLILAGFFPWQTYLTEVIPTMSRGYAYYPNQSINGIVHRWLGHNPSYAFSELTPAISIANLSSLIVFNLLAVCPRLIGATRKTVPAQKNCASNLPGQSEIVLRTLDLGIAMLSVLLASPITWEHHFSWTVILFAICLERTRFMKDARRVIAGLALSYFFLGTYFMPVQTASSGLVSLINSPMFFGALMLFVMSWLCYIRVYKDQLKKI